MRFINDLKNVVFPSRNLAKTLERIGVNNGETKCSLRTLFDIEDVMMKALKNINSIANDCSYCGYSDSDRLQACGKISQSAIDEIIKIGSSVTTKL